MRDGERWTSKTQTATYEPFLSSRWFSFQCQSPLDKGSYLCHNTPMDQETETQPDFKSLYSSDVEDMVNWAGLAEYEPEDIKAMIPLIMERLITLL